MHKGSRCLHLLASLPLRTSTCSFLLLHLAPPLLLLPGRHLLNSPPIFCSLRIAFCIPFILRPTSSVLLCRSVAPVPASAGWVDQQTGRRPAGAGGPLPLHRQRPRAHSSRPTHTTPWGRGGVPNLARGMSLRTQVHLVRLSVLHPRVRWGPLPPPQVLRTSIYSPTRRLLAIYSPSFGLLLGLLSVQSPHLRRWRAMMMSLSILSKRRIEVRNTRGYNASLRRSVCRSKVMTISRSLSSRSKRRIGLCNTVASSVKLLRFLHGLLPAAQLKTRRRRPQRQRAIFFALFLPVPTGSNARVIHAHDRRGSVPALPARAARLERINLAHYARLIVLLLLLIFPVVFGAGSDDATGKVPVFSGTPTDFHPWFILFSAYVPWKLTEASDILSGQEPKPVVPAPPISTPGTPSGDVAITNATAVSEAKAALEAWNTKITRSFMA